jgi:hypothetical protein
MARRVAFHAGFSQPESPGNFEKVEGHVNCDGSRDYVANCGQQIAKGSARGAARTLASQRLINAGLGIRLCLEFVRDYWNYRKLPRLNS